MPLSSRKLLFLFTLALISAAAIFRISDLDFWWHLKTGQLIIQQRAFQYEEVYSFTAAGREYIDHEWLFQVIAYLSYAAAGPAGVIILKTLIIATTYGLMAHHLLARGSSPLLAAGILMLSVCAGLQRFIERPEVFSAFYLATIYLLVDSYLRDNRLRPLALVPPIILIWANTHAAVITGLLLIAIFVTGLAVEHFARKSEIGFPGARLGRRPADSCALRPAGCLDRGGNHQSVRVPDPEGAV
jgi:hypothetical protein